ncbi:hypothetical protein NE237_025219 [Protea cynaroides]|uniref:Uncharacterized protein n=1 Tax=Protea cynaroides TaxID=273540 RepID=A0A9Q0H1Z3_9MAGN|nr:hypothetical protein NE237_025219 [Protea cynaroides]
MKNPMADKRSSSISDAVESLDTIPTLPESRTTGTTNFKFLIGLVTDSAGLVKWEDQPGLDFWLASMSEESAWSDLEQLGDKGDSWSRTKGGKSSKSRDEDRALDGEGSEVIPLEGRSSSDHKAAGIDCKGMGSRNFLEVESLAAKEATVLASRTSTKSQLEGIEGFRWPSPPEKGKGGFERGDWAGRAQHTGRGEIIHSAH